jgi:glycosyltransferase involved in cell wall biosynthesis
MLVKNTFTHDARVWREAQALQKSGHDVQVVALLGPGLLSLEKTSEGIQIERVSRGPGSSLRGVSDPTSSASSQTNLKVKFKKFVVQVVRYAARTPLSGWVQAGIDSRMKTLVLQFKPDVIHAHDLETLELASDLRQELGIPLIYDSHEIASERNHHTRSQKRKAGIKEAKLIHNADSIIMVSNGCAQFTSEKYGVPLPTVIMNTPDFDPAGAEVRDLRKALNIPARNIVLVHQGSLQRNRGIEQSIEAVRSIPNVTYVIIGYGQHRPFLEDFVSKSGLSEKVKFFGPVPADELIEWTASADIGICTIVGKTKSYLYAMPNKLFEYTMAGLPVVASNYPDMGQFVSDNKMGVTCDPESLESITTAISVLVNDSELRHELGLGAKVARNEFNWEKEQRKLHDLYAQLA